MAALTAAGQSVVPFRDHELVREVAKYNVKDCRAVWELLSFFRKEL